MSLFQPIALGPQTSPLRALGTTLWAPPPTPAGHWHYNTHHNVYQWEGRNYEPYLVEMPDAQFEAEVENLRRFRQLARATAK